MSWARTRSLEVYAYIISLTKLVSLSTRAIMEAVGNPYTEEPTTVTVVLYMFRLIGQSNEGFSKNYLPEAGNRFNNLSRFQIKII